MLTVGDVIRLWDNKKVGIFLCRLLDDCEYCPVADLCSSEANGYTAMLDDVVDEDMDGSMTLTPKGYFS